MPDDTYDPCWWVVVVDRGRAKLSPCRTLSGARSMLAMLRACGVSAALVLSVDAQPSEMVQSWAAVNGLIPQMQGRDADVP